MCLGLKNKGTVCHLQRCCLWRVWEALGSVTWRVKTSSNKQATLEFNQIQGYKQGECPPRPRAGGELGKKCPSRQAGSESTGMQCESPREQPRAWRSSTPTAVSRRACLCYSNKIKAKHAQGTTGRPGTLKRTKHNCQRVPLIHRLQSAWTMSPSDTLHSCMYSGDWTEKINFPV